MCSMIIALATASCLLQPTLAQPVSGPFQDLRTSTEGVDPPKYLLPRAISTGGVALPSGIKSPLQLDVQPDKGGGPADDCGGGPINLDAITWNSRGMDNLLKSFWDKGSAGGDNDFDFHQAFAQQYNVNLYCPHAHQQCTGIPSSCSALTGTTQQKEQGWLFINAMVAAQDLFTQTYAASDIAFQSITTLIEEYSTIFFDNKPVSRAVGRTLTGAAASLIGIAVGVAAIGATGGTAIAGVIATNLVPLAISSINNNAGGLKDTTSDPLLGLTGSGAWSGTFASALTALDNSHSAAWSNGYVNGTNTGTLTLPNLLAGGAFAGWEQLLSTFDPNSPSLVSLLRNIMIEGLIADRMLEQNTFQIYVPNVVNDCSKWKGNTGSNQERRLCRPEGMYIMNTYTPGSSELNPPTGLNSKDIAGFAGLGMNLQALMNSSAQYYQKHGVMSNTATLDYTELMGAYSADPADFWNYPGLFQVPVCELIFSDWKQSDQMSPTKPPCDCKTATDHWGGSFLNSVTPDLQAWWNQYC